MNHAHYELIIRDADEGRVGQNIPCFNTLKEVRAYVNKRLKWLNRMHYTVDVVFYKRIKSSQQGRPE